MLSKAQNNPPQGGSVIAVNQYQFTPSPMPQKRTIISYLRKKHILAMNEFKVRMFDQMNLTDETKVPIYGVDLSMNHCFWTVLFK